LVDVSCGSESQTDGTGVLGVLGFFISFSFYTL